MMRAVAMLAVLLAAAALISCATYRNTFKLTIEVEVDGERKIASSVYEREIYSGIGGVADRTRGTMPHMSLGRHGDIVLSMAGGGGRIGSVRRKEPLYVTEKVTWYYPPFNRGQEPAKAVRYPARGKAEIAPAGHLLSLLVVWRPPDVTNITQFKRIWFDSLSDAIDPAVRPVRITIEPTSEPLLFSIPDAPKWIRNWRQQYRELPNDILVPASATTYHQRDYFSPAQFETKLGS